MLENTPGKEQYIPTRLDWLSVILNSVFQGRSIGSGFEIFYIAADDGKSIILAVRHYVDMDGELVDSLVERAKNVVFTVAREYEWDSWIEVITDVEPAERQMEQEA